MNKKVLLALSLLALSLLVFTPLASLTAAPGDNTVRGILDLSSVPHKIIWTIEAAFLSEISKTQDDGYLIDGQYTSIQDITDYISRVILLPIPEAGELSYQIDGKIGAEPEIIIPVTTFAKAG
ncbi:MAG: hypothetical protein H8D65_03005, partial [Spirochaetes bacterium]|nr:hypothetical protein [Spirochaetota bacterium]